MSLETLKTDGAPPIVTSRSLTAVPCKNPRGNLAERTAAERGQNPSELVQTSSDECSQRHLANWPGP